MYFYFQMTILAIFLCLGLVALFRSSRPSPLNSEAELLIVLENRLALLNAQQEPLPTKSSRIVCD